MAIMKPQLFVGNTEPTLELLSPPKNFTIRKPSGGLWTSTYLGDQHGSDWVQWCIGNNFRVPDNKRWKSWLLYPRKDIFVYEVDSFDDLVELMNIAKLNPMAEAYERAGVSHTPFPTFPDNPFMRSHPEFDFNDQPDFEKIALDFDAINLTDQGQVQTRHGVPNLYGWDCESTVWFGWLFDKVEYLGEIEYKPIW